MAFYFLALFHNQKLMSEGKVSINEIKSFCKIRVKLVRPSCILAVTMVSHIEETFSPEMKTIVKQH